MTHYRLDRDETLSEGTSRILSELSEEALGHLEFPDGPVEGVHEARKTCKKARGLARLVRPELGNYSEVNQSFRDAARRLGPVRDPQAFLDTFDDLAATPAASYELGSLRSHFAVGAEEATERIQGEDAWRLEEAAELIRAGQHVGDWEMHDDFDSIAAGVEKTYRRGRESMNRAEGSGDPDDFHEWRKRAKYLWYQVRLLRNAAPSVLRPLSRRLHDVSDALGDAHDLVLMQARVGSFEADAAAKEAFRIVASGYRVELEGRALSLGRRLWVEEPGVFVDRLEGYWDAWAQGAELDAGEIEDITPTADSPAGLSSVA